MLKGLFGLGRRPAPLTAHVPTPLASPIGAELPSAARTALAPTLPRPIAAVSGRELGELLGGVYPVLRRLGEGGFGKVFLCRHPAWNIEVAVKLPHDDALKDPRTLPDLEHEAEEWTGLGLHPNITYCYHLHPVGTPPLPLLVVEYVAGGTLRQRIEGTEAVTDLRGNLDLAIQLCHALEHAHGRGLIHRDLKPENVLLTADGTVKLTDFGIARRGAVEGAASASGGVVQSSAIGTAGYMAPEQLIPGAMIDARADLYALGACLYELFCFALPYSGRAARGRTPLSPVALRWDRALPQGLDALLPRLVSWEAAGRPASAGAVREELASIYETSYGEASRYAELPELPLTASGHNNRGVSFHFLGKFEQAEAAFRDALAADPLHPEATFNIGLIRWRRGEVTDMALLRELEQTSAAFGGWRSHYLLGLVHLERHDREEAMASLKAAAASAPERPEVAAALARARAGGGDAWVRRLRSFEGHTSGVNAVAFSPNGRLALSGSEDKTLRLWEMTSGECLRTYQGHTHGVLSIAFSPNGRQALSGSRDNTLRLWELSDGECLRVFQGHTRWVSSVSFAPDRTIAMSGGRDATLRLWNSTTGKCLRSFADHAAGEFWPSIAFSPNGRLALSSTDSNILRLWGIDSGKYLRTFEGHTGRLNAVSFSPDNTLALSGSDDTTLRLWEVASGTCLQIFQGHADSITSVAFSPNGRRVLSGSADATLRLWDVDSGKCLRTIEGHTRAVHAVTFSPDGLLALSGVSSTYTIFVNRRETLWAWWLGNAWDDRSVLQLAEPEPLSILLETASRRAKLLEVIEIEFNAGNFGEALRVLASLEELPGQERHPEIMAIRNKLAARCRRTGIRAAWPLWQLDDEAGFHSVAFSRDGRRALYGGEDFTLRLWDLASGECLHSFDDRLDYVTAVAFSADSSLALSASNNGTLRLWDVTRGTHLRRLEGHTARVLSIAFSPDGKVAVSGGEDGTIRLWDIASGRCLRIFSGQREWVNAIAFSPDGSKAVSGGDLGHFLLWDVTSGSCIHQFAGDTHTVSVNSVTVSPTGRQVLSGDHDGARMWDMASGTCLRRFEGHTGPVNSVAFSPDGKVAVSGGEDGTIRLWRTENGECLHALSGDGYPISAIAQTADPTVLLSATASSTQLWHMDWNLLPEPEN